jgi:hypothetical protein
MSSKVAGNIEQIISKTTEIAKLAAELLVLEQTKAEVSDTGLGRWLARIYDDQSLTNTEFQQLRDEADHKLDRLKDLYPERNELAMFQKAADDAVQQMQVGILKFKSKKLPKDAKSDIQQAYAFQVAYIQACLDRFTQML